MYDGRTRENRAFMKRMLELKAKENQTLENL